MIKKKEYEKYVSALYFDFNVLLVAWCFNTQLLFFMLLF